MEGYKLTIRLLAMGLLVVLMVFVMGGRLVGLQIMTQAPAYVHTDEVTYTHTVPVPAARGEILDRYGRPLVQNQTVYSITIDREYLHTGGKACETIYALVRQARDLGVEYTDTLPVSMPPYRYTFMDDTVRGQFEHYLSKMQWDDPEASELMTLLYLDYGMMQQDEETGQLRSLYDWTPEEMRLVAGVLYEVEMRYQAGLAEKALEQTYYYVPHYTFAEDVPMSLIMYISENRLRGPQVTPRNIREYQTDSAAHMLGRIGQIFADNADYYKDLGYSMDELVGLDGAEKAFESWLRGTPGQETVVTDSQGRILSKTAVPPQAGNNVYLTLDIRLQAEVERILEAGVKNLNETGTALKGLEAEAATAVILDVKTSEVLAAANYPTYSLDAFNEDYDDMLQDPLKPMLNRAISGTYAPGSVFKMVTATAALESGPYTTQSVIRDRGRYTYYADSQPKCWVYPGNHGNETVSTALRDSCNYYFYETGRVTGISKIVHWAEMYGLGKKTGIEIDGEAEGMVAGPVTSESLGDYWTDGNTLSAAIGQQNNQFTPIQMANYVASIANNGRLNQTHLLYRVVSYDYGRSYYFARSQELQNLGIDPENLAAIQKGMFLVTSEGTAKAAFRDYPINIAGKTGSVQVGDKPNNGVFVAYAPYEDPQIAVALVVEKGGAGSSVAPLALEIIDAWFQLQDELIKSEAENSLKR